MDLEWGKSYGRRELPGSRTGFEDFRMDAMENFPKVDFSSIKLNLAAATNSLIQTSFEDVNIEDDATT